MSGHVSVTGYGRRKDAERSRQNEARRKREAETPPEPTHYRVESATTPGLVYRVDVKDGRAVCNCRGSSATERLGRNCKHARLILQKLGARPMSDNGTTAVTVRDNAADLVSVTPPQSLFPDKAELGAMMAIANSVYKTSGKMIPSDIKTPEEAFAVMLAGREYGLGPMASFREVYLVKGRTQPSYRVIAGLILNGDPKATLTWKERSANRACVVLRRGNGMSIEVEYTMADAKRSGQAANDVWTKYPIDMLAKSALVRACRLAGADLLTGIGAAVKHAPAVMAALEDADDGEPLPQLDQVTVPNVTTSDDDHADEQRAHQHKTAAPAAQEPDARLPVIDALKGSMKRIDGQYAAPNVAQLKASIIASVAKQTEQGNIAWGRMSMDELGQAARIIADFEAGAPAEPVQAALTGDDE